MLKNFINKLYQRFGKDKVFHFSACFAIALIIGLVLMPFTNIYIVLFSSFMTANAAALGKEYGDKCSPVNKWDWEDVVADYAGTFTGLTLLLIIYIILL